MDVNLTVRRVLTAALALAILLWAEAALALLPGDQVVMQCRAMMLQGHAQAVAPAGESDAMPCCPADSAHGPKLAASHPPCCSSGDVPERPLAFLVISDRTTAHPFDTAAEVAASFVPPRAQRDWELRSSDAPHSVRAVLDLKSDLRI